MIQPRAKNTFKIKLLVVVYINQLIPEKIGIPDMLMPRKTAFFKPGKLHN